MRTVKPDVEPSARSERPTGLWPGESSLRRGAAADLHDADLHDGDVPGTELSGTELSGRTSAQDSPVRAGVETRADWSRRAPGFLIDFAPGILALIPLTVAYVLFLVALLQAPVGTESTLPDLSGVLVWAIVGGVLLLVMLGWAVQNRWLVGGQTGQSLGRRVMKVRLLSEQTGEPVEAANAFARDLAHCLDLVSLVGFLWPLWDARRQTFADMIMNTVVVDERGQDRVS